MDQQERQIWCNWPHEENARELDELAQMTARCFAWTQFFSEQACEQLRLLEGSFVWFSRYEHFDKLIMTFGCTEAELRAKIIELMLPNVARDVTFRRKDLYDARAWAYITLDCFAELDADPRTGEPSPYSDPRIGHLPLIHFGINKQWQVSRDSFKVKHRLTSYATRKAKMVFSHPDLDARFDNARWAADGEFPRTMPIADIKVALFADVEKRCAQHMVTIVDQENTP